MGLGREWMGRVAAVRVWLVWLSCGLGAAGCLQSAWAQSATDGAIGGQVLSAAGRPVAGALVVVHGSETGLAMRTLSGAKGEFLVVRLPVGEYVVTVEDAGVALTLPGPVAVGLGEVTEVEAQLRPRGHGQADEPAVASGAGMELTGEDLAALPVDGGGWRSLALTLPGANRAAGAEDDSADVSFRGVAVSQNSTRSDGASGDEGFSGARVGAGVEEDAEAGSDEVSDRTSGVGSGSRSVADGGQRAGSSYTFSQAAVREFRVQGQGGAAAYGSALYGHGVGGVVTTVSRAGGTTLHGMAFYTVRDSGWAATNPFSVASTYANGVVANAVVKPVDVRQQFGGRLGGPAPWLGGDHGSARMSTDRRQKLFYFYAFDQ